MNEVKEGILENISFNVIIGKREKVIKEVEGVNDFIKFYGKKSFKMWKNRRIIFLINVFKGLEGRFLKRELWDLIGSRFLVIFGENSFCWIVRVEVWCLGLEVSKRMSGIVMYGLFVIEGK